MAFDAIPRVKLAQEEVRDVSAIFMCSKYNRPHYFNADSSAFKNIYATILCIDKFRARLQLILLSADKGDKR